MSAVEVRDPGAVECKCVGTPCAHGRTHVADAELDVLREYGFDAVPEAARHGNPPSRTRQVSGGVGTPYGRCFVSGKRSGGHRLRMFHEFVVLLIRTIHGWQGHVSRKTTVANPAACIARWRSPVRRRTVQALGTPSADARHGASRTRLGAERTSWSQFSARIGLRMPKSDGSGSAVDSLSWGVRTEMASAVRPPEEATRQDPMIVRAL